MENKLNAEFDFDFWSALARDDPAGFESQRLQLIAALIESAPEAHRHRLRCLQWRIDQERRLAANPLGACVRISRMMWQAMLGRNGLRQRLGHLQDMFGSADCRSDQAHSGGARVLAFARRAD